MKIGIYGHYGHGEFCDDYIEMAIKNTFDNITETKNEWVRLPSNDYNLDLILLGGGSILGVDYDYNILKKTNIPFYIFGSGFRDSENSFNVQYLLDRSSGAFVRGKVSKQKLESLNIDTSKIVGFGDPIFLCRKKTVVSKNFIGGVFRPYITDKKIMGQIFGYLKTERKQNIKLFSFSKPQTDHLGASSIGYKTVDADVIQTYNEMIKSSFWFGNRLHPFSIALIYDIPTIGLDIEFDKVEDLCSSIHYNYYIKNEDLNIDTFRCMYNNVIKNHEVIDKNVQTEISIVRNNLETFARKIVDSVI